MIIQKVGQGGLGAVYKAVDSHSSNRLCAIKEMSDSIIANQEEKRLAVLVFQREADD